MIQKYMLRGNHGIESFSKMFKQHPLATSDENDWWNDKRPDMKKIKIPTYITGTWTNSMHGMGAIRGWLEVDCEEKWLRWHPYQEWYDIWGNPQAKEELFMFMDHYLKGINNDWLKTPKVRMAVLRFGESDPIANKVVKDFPIPGTDYQKFYLQSDSTMSHTKSSSAENRTMSYDGKTGSLSFKHTFEEKTQIVGMPKAILHMSCKQNDDMDIYLILRKLSATGEEMWNLNVPWSAVPVDKIADIPDSKRTEVLLYKGPTGILRASNRKIDASKSMHENWPYYTHDEVQKVTPGDVVRLEIGIWAMGIEYEAGESIVFEVSGHSRGIVEFGKDKQHTDNKGQHVLHLGGQYDSHLILPVVPLL